MANLVSENTIQGDHKLVWMVDDNGWIHEARITTPGRGDYHGYPLLPGDAMATKILTRFANWALDEERPLAADDPTAREALRAAQERYRG
jgi:hypothetical protein